MLVRVSPRAWAWGAAILLSVTVLLVLRPAISRAQDEKALGATGPPPVPRPDAAAREQPVIRVINGDTLIVRVDGQARRLGLAGIVAPPRSQPGGIEAQRALQNLLAGETVFVELAQTPPETDRFGRVPAYLHRAPEGLLINLELVREGYARVDAGGDARLRELLSFYEQRAQTFEKGLWAIVWSEAALPATTAPAIPATPEAAKETEQAKPSAEPVKPPAAPARGGAADVVYVTPSGEKYHTSACRYARNAQAVSLAEAKARGLQPCKQCKPPE